MEKMWATMKTVISYLGRIIGMKMTILIFIHNKDTLTKTTRCIEGIIILCVSFSQLQ